MQTSVGIMPGSIAPPSPPHLIPTLKKGKHAKMYLPNLLNHSQLKLLPPINITKLIKY